LFFETKEKWKNAKGDELTEKVRKLLVGNFIFIIYKLREFYDK